MDVLSHIDLILILLMRVLAQPSQTQHKPRYRLSVVSFVDAAAVVRVYVCDAKTASAPGAKSVCEHAHAHTRRQACALSGSYAVLHRTRERTHTNYVYAYYVRLFTYSRAGWSHCAGSAPVPGSVASGTGV